jgi:hypothetical protein
MPESSHTPTLLDPELLALAARECTVAAARAEHFALECLDRQGESVEWCLASSRSLREISVVLMQPITGERIEATYQVVRATYEMVRRCTVIVNGEHLERNDEPTPLSLEAFMDSSRAAIGSLGAVLRTLEP